MATRIAFLIYLVGGGGPEAPTPGGNVRCELSLAAGTQAVLQLQQLLLASMSLRLCDESHPPPRADIDTPPCSVTISACSGPGSTKCSHQDKQAC